MKFKDFPLSEVGQTIMLVGGIWADDSSRYFFILPEYVEEDGGPSRYSIMMEAGLPEWQELLRQSDLVETEVLSKCQDGKLYKAIVRKCQRSVEQSVVWNVFRRDNYTCRYCGRNTVPLTVDHLVLWEEGGPSTEENLVACCRRCNKTRGCMEYGKWLSHPYYAKVSRNLSAQKREENETLAGGLWRIERVVKMRKR